MKNGKKENDVIEIDHPKKEVSSKLVFIVAILVIFIVASCAWILGVQYAENEDKQDDNKVVETEKTDKKEETKLDKEVEEALNYIYVYTWKGFSLDLDYDDGEYKKNNESYGMFADYKVDVNNLSLYGKYHLIVQLLEKDGYFDEVEYYKYKEEGNYEDLVLATEEDLKNYDKSESNQCVADEIVRKYPKINKSLISRYAKDIFGINNIEILSFNYNCISCELVNGEYSCRNNTGGTGTGNASWEYKYVDYEKNNDEMYIYHKAFYGMGEVRQTGEYSFEGVDNYLIFNTDDINKYQNEVFDENGNYVIDKEHFIAKVKDSDCYDSDKLLDEYGVTFKSIFKKNSDGEYRWVSTEPVSEK